MAVLADLEVTLGEAGDGSAMSIDDVDGDVDQAGLDPDSRHLWRGTALDRGLREQCGSESERGELHRWALPPGYDLVGKGFARCPDGAVNEVLFLPDGDSLLEGIDQPAAGVEGRSTVRRGDDNEHTGLADLETSETVNQGHIADRELCKGFSGEATHLTDGHLFVGLVVKEESLAATSIVADDAVEDAYGTIRSGFDLIENLRRWNDCSDEFDSHASHLPEAPPLTGGSRATSSPSRSTVSRLA